MRKIHLLMLSCVFVTGIIMGCAKAPSVEEKPEDRNSPLNEEVDEVANLKKQLAR